MRAEVSGVVSLAYRYSSFFGILLDLALNCVRESSLETWFGLESLSGRPPRAWLLVDKLVESLAAWDPSIFFLSPLDDPDISWVGLVQQYHLVFSASTVLVSRSITVY